MRKLILTALVLGLAACGGQNASTPVPQPDTVVFGRVAEIHQVADTPGAWDVDVRTGLPETLQTVMRKEGKPIPELEKDLTTRVRVTADTVCVSGLRPGTLASFRQGQEVAVVPQPGTCAMVGTKLFLATAAELYTFSAYQLRYLPRTLEQVPDEVSDRADPSRVNSSGVERTPLPLDGGRVLYFSAGLLPPVGPQGAPRGAVRKGMRQGEAPAPWALGGYRPYRTAWNGKAWGEPTPVELPGLAPAASARITWMDEAETDCLVSVEQAGAPNRLMRSRRGTARAPWGALEPVEQAAGESVGDGQFFGKADGSLVWTVYGASGSDLWLAPAGKAGQPLEPRINTLGPEWAPRVGPGTVLYFCRADRQLLFAGGVVREVRLPGPQRLPLLEAAPTADGEWLFFTVPLYTPGQPDTDVAVAPRDGKGWGAPMLLDDWRPE